MLEVQHLTKVYSKDTVNEKVAMNDVSFTFEDQDFISVVGSNGAGKSTLFQLLSGTIFPDAGHIYLNDQDITLMPQHKRAKMIGHLYQNTQVTTAPNMTVLENLALSYLRGKKETSMFSKISKADRAFFQQELLQLEMGLEDRLDEKVGNLSGGQRQGLALLMATMNPYELLLLDEHTAALDPKAAKQVMKLTQEIVEREKKTCMMITHNLHDALTYGNKMIVLHQGKVLFTLDENEKKNMSVEDLLEKFQQFKTTSFQDDRMLFEI